MNRPNTNVLRKMLIIATFFLTTISCSESAKEADVLQPTGKVLARVNGDAITEEMVEQMIMRTFGDIASIRGQAQLKDKVLESLISSSAMMHIMKDELKPEELNNLQAMTRAYSEELYVKAYLQKYAEPEPVSSTMVREYYEQHPEEFGGGERKSFELLIAPKNLDVATQDKLVANLATIRSAEDWPAKKLDWFEKYKLQLQVGTNHLGLLQPALDQALSKLVKGETSNAVYLNGQLNIIRLTDVQVTPAKNLFEVSADIRKKLSPLIVRDAVKLASEAAREKVNIVFEKN